MLYGRTLPAIPNTLALALSVLVATAASDAHAQRTARKTARRSLLKRTQTEVRAKRAPLARSRPGEPYRKLERMLDHPYLRRTRVKSWDRSERRDLIHTVAFLRRDEGVVIRRDPTARARLKQLWTRLARSSRIERVNDRGKFWIEERPDGANAEAFPNGAVAFGVEYFEMAHAIARAQTSATSRQTFLRRLSRVARRAAEGRYDLRFEGEARPGDPAYESVVDGVIGVTLAHELAHIHYDHGGLDWSRTETGDTSGLRDLARDYLGSDVDPAELSERRLFNQRNEFEADYGGLEFALRAGLDPDAILSDILVNSMIEGLITRRSADRTHPIGLDRFEGTRARLQSAGYRTRFDGVSRKELLRIYAESSTANDQ